jgi:hypothetical protein
VPNGLPATSTPPVIDSPVAGLIVGISFIGDAVMDVCQ